MKKTFHKVTHKEFAEHIARFSNLSTWYYRGTYGFDLNFFVKRGKGQEKVAGIFIKYDESDTVYGIYK